MANRGEIERILHKELERARSLYDSETDQFRTATRGMISSDASQREETATIRAAGAGRRAALEAYSLALKRFTDFIVNGIVPSDLKKN